MNAARIAPLSAPSPLPTANAVNRTGVTLIPSASAASGFSRTARSTRHTGAREIRRTTHAASAVSSSANPA